MPHAAASRAMEPEHTMQPSAQTQHQDEHIALDLQEGLQTGCTVENDVSSGLLADVFRELLSGPQQQQQSDQQAHR